VCGLVAKPANANLKDPLDTATLADFPGVNMNTSWHFAKKRKFSTFKCIQCMALKK
jgi:hypothetical protein